MKLNFIVVVLLIAALSACDRGSTTPQVSTGPITSPARASDRPALRMVRDRQMASNLAPLAWSIAKGTHSLGAVAEKYGADRASATMAYEIQKLIPDYVGRWEEKLADAYSHQLSDEELSSIAKDGSQSPYFQKLVSAQPAVSEEMKQTGLPIIQELLTKAFSNALNKST